VLCSSSMPGLQAADAIRAFDDEMTAFGQLHALPGAPHVSVPGLGLTVTVDTSTTVSQTAVPQRAPKWTDTAKI
jgi:hypothetical protein